MKAVVTGATGFVGAHVTKALAERGDEVRVTYRDPAPPGRSGRRPLPPPQGRRHRLPPAPPRLPGAEVALPRRRLRGVLARRAPVAAQRRRAGDGRRGRGGRGRPPRRPLTSTISAIGVPSRPGARRRDHGVPAQLARPGLPRFQARGEVGALAAGERSDVEVIVVNPAYVLGVPVNQSQAGETSTRTVGQYLTGRLPAVVGSAMNFVDVDDVARGHVLAADHGRAGERYILGGENLAWADLVDWMADISGIHYPVVILPGSVGRLGRIREAAGLRGVLPAEAIDLMRRDWRYTSAKATRELGYETRPIDDTIRATVEWYRDLIDAGAFHDEVRSSMSTVASSGRRRRSGCCTRSGSAGSSSGAASSWASDGAPAPDPGTTALITGASSGIGAEIAAGWPRAGCR